MEETDAVAGLVRTGEGWEKVEIADE